MSVLQQGSTGPDVITLQTMLKALGFDPNGTDGNFGPGTKAAVIAFQQSKGLTADGKAGPVDHGRAPIRRLLGECRSECWRQRWRR